MTLLGTSNDAMLEIIEASLRFHWDCGDVTRVKADHSTNERCLPHAIVSQAEKGIRILRIIGEPDRVVTGNCALFIRPNQPHEIIFRESSSSGSPTRWAHFYCTVFGSLDLFTLFRTPTMIRKKRATQIGDVCRDLASISNGQDDDPLRNTCRRQALGLQLLMLLLDVSSREPTSPGFLTRLTRMRPVFRSLEHDLSMSVTRESLASLVHLSPTHFHTLFKEITGTAPMLYVGRLRLQRARELLITSDQSIGQIAESVGYSDLAHFSHTFKKVFGISPLQYRNSQLVSLSGDPAILRVN